MSQILHHIKSFLGMNHDNPKAVKIYPTNDSPLIIYNKSSQHPCDPRLSIETIRNSDTGFTYNTYVKRKLVYV